MNELRIEEGSHLWPTGAVKPALPPEVVAPETKLIPDGLERTLKIPQPGDFMLDERFLPGISRLTIQAAFNELPEMGKGREASGRMVRFGQLLLDSEDDGAHALFVAIKPFYEDEVSEAAHEYSVASYFASGKVPGIDTYRPLGIYRFEDGQRGVISHYRHSLRSLDNDLWQPDKLNNPLIIKKALGRVGTSLAAIHNQGWFHGDAQAKNFAWDITKSTDDTFLIDVETTKPFPGAETKTTDDDEPADASEAIKRDIEKFIGSVYHLKDMGEELPDDYDEWVKDNFGLTYAKAHHPQTGKTVVELYEQISQIVDEQSHYV